MRGKGILIAIIRRKVEGEESKKKKVEDGGWQ